MRSATCEREFGCASTDLLERRRGVAPVAARDLQLRLGEQRVRIVGRGRERLVDQLAGFGGLALLREQAAP